MRATLLVVVARAAAVAALCAAGGLEVESECCAAKLTDLRVENIALRKVNERLASELDECRAESVKQPLVWRLAAELDHRDGLNTAAAHKDAPAPPLPRVPGPRRKTLATPAPTPLTPIPTTATPSAMPSASPVPTTEGVTTHAQLANAVADVANAEVIIEAPLAFPSQAPITIGTERSVSVVGSAASGGGRVTLDGAGGSRLFLVKDSGTLSLAFLDLVNATVPGNVTVDCPDDKTECYGGTILVLDGGSLVVTSCAFRGGGPGEDPVWGNAYSGGGVALNGGGSNGEFHEVKFSNFRATWGVAVSAFACGIDSPCLVNFYSCQIEDNSAVEGMFPGVVWLGWYFIEGSLYDCTFARNNGCALHLTATVGAPKIVRCAFTDNTGAPENLWPSLGGAGLMLVNLRVDLDMRDCVFTRNVGASGLDGGAVSVVQTTLRWRNISFISNTGYRAAIFSAGNGASMTLIDCFALKNHAAFESGGFVAEGGTEVYIFNSTFAKSSTVGDGGFQVHENSVVSAHNTTFRDCVASNTPVLAYRLGSSGSLSDCLFTNNRAISNAVGVMELDSDSVVTLLRAVVVDNSAATFAGCFRALSGAILTVDDSDIVNCRSDDTTAYGGGAFVVMNTGTTIITNSRIHGSSVTTLKGSVATVVPGGLLRIAGSAISDSAGKFAINDASGIDFSVQVRS